MRHRARRQFAARLSPLGTERGVTLIEMLIVVSIIALMAGIMFPSATSGLDSIRMASAADSLAAFMTSAVNRAERQQVLIEFTVSKVENAVYIRHTPDFERRFEMPDGIRITAVLPEAPVDPALPRRYLIYPGGTPPKIGVRIANARGAQRIVSLDPITAVANVEKVPDARR